MTVAEASTSAPRRRRLQFRLGGLFVITLVVALPLGWFANQLARQRARTAAEERITKLGGWALPNLYSQGLPTTFEIYLGDTKVTDDDLKLLDAFANEESIELHLTNTNISDAGLEHLRKLRNLQSLWVGGTQVTARGISRLDSLSPAARARATAEQRITELGGEFDRTLVSSHRLDREWEVSTLSISFRDTAITDEDLKQLAPFFSQIPSYLRLDLAFTNISDEGLEGCRTVSRLGRLLVTGSRITPAALERLKAAIPNLDVTD